MKYTLFLILIFIGFGAFSQNYKGVVEGDTTYYYGASEAYFNYYPQPASILRAIWIENKGIIGTDSIFTFFSSPRVDSTNPATAYCIDSLNGASWMGKTMVRKPNGDEIYQNHKYESILIQTQASLGANWKIVTDLYGTEIWGTVTQLSSSIIDNVTDSIKVITLQAQMAGNPISHFLNGKNIIMSKNHGFVKAFEWYIFPYNLDFYNSSYNYLPTDTSTFTRIDRQITEMDQNYINFQTMFQPGTYWQYIDSFYQRTNSGMFIGHFIDLNRYQDSIVSRTFISPDSLIVNFQRKHVFQTESSPAFPGPPFDFIPTTTTISTSTYSDTIIKLPVKTIRTNFLPEHLSSNFTGGGNIRLPLSSFKKITDSIYAVSKFNEYMSSYIGFQFQYNCVSLIYNSSGYWSDEFTFIRNVNNSNLFRFQTDPNSTAIYHVKKIDYYFYKDSNQTYGTPVNLITSSIPEISFEKTIKIYPNPSLSGIFQIQTDKPLEWEVFSLQGQKIKSGNESTINIQNHTSGIYFLKVYEKEKSYFTKLIIQ